MKYDGLNKDELLAKLKEIERAQKMAEYLRQQLAQIEDFMAGRARNLDNAVVVCQLLSGEKVQYDMAQRPDDATAIPPHFEYIGQGTFFSINGIEDKSEQKQMVNFYRTKL